MLRPRADSKISDTVSVFSGKAGFKAGQHVSYKNPDPNPSYVM
jgi:hypothetical protein